MAVKPVPIPDVFGLCGDPQEQATSPRSACAEMGTDCSSKRARQRIGRIKGAASIAQTPGCTAGGTCVQPCPRAPGPKSVPCRVPTLFAWTNHTAVALAGRHKIFDASNRMCL